MGYTSTLTFIENITKAVQRLPNYLRQTFYRHTREIIETEVISLLDFVKGHISEREEAKCSFCSKKHKVTNCEDFISCSINVKNEFVKGIVK